MEEPVTNQSKILEKKMRRQLKEPSDNAVAWNMKHYISGVMLQTDNDKQETDMDKEQEAVEEEQEALEEAENLSEMPGIHENEVSAEFRIEDSLQRLGSFKIKEEIERVEYKAIKIGYEAYRQAADEERKQGEEKSVSFDRKG